MQHAANSASELNSTDAAKYTKGRFSKQIKFLQLFFPDLSIGAFFVRRVGEAAKKPFSNSEERTDQ